MKKLLLILLLLTKIEHQVSAQDGKKEMIFSSQASGGITVGEIETGLHVEILNGIRYKTWFGGVGAGFDDYYLRSVPLYFSAIKYLSPRSHSFYVQGDGGINIPWQEDQIAGWNEVSNRYKTGAYWNGLIGFVTGLDKKNSFSFGVGYSLKHLKQIRETAVFCINPPCENSVETYNYDLRRISLKLGWQFNYSH